MEKIKNFFEWCVAIALVGFVCTSFLVGSLWTINTIVEIICNIFGV